MRWLRQLFARWHRQEHRSQPMPLADIPPLPRVQAELVETEDIREARAAVEELRARVVQIESRIVGRSGGRT